MARYVSDTSAGKAISAYVILNKRGEYVAKVTMHHASSCLVNVFQSGKALERSEAAAMRALGKLPADGLGFQFGRASGYGYDKATAALSGLYIDGHKLTDHCSRDGAPKPPKGRTLYPRDAKPKAGYSFANYSTRRKSDGKDMRSHDWKCQAIDELGEGSEWSAVSERMAELESAFLASDDCEAGYMSCHRDPGLRYLESIGYRVIQAI